MDPNEAPVVENGQGVEPEETSAAPEFESPEALQEAYQTSKAELDAAKEQLANLESLKGRQGNELGKLRNEVQRLQGLYEGALQAKETFAERQTGQRDTSVSDIVRRLDEGEISSFEAERLLSQIAQGDQDPSKLKEEIAETIFGELDRRAYVEKFLSDNPDYERVYNEGHLDHYINDLQMSGEQAYDRYVREQTEKQNADLSSKLEALSKEVSALKTQTTQRNDDRLRQGSGNAGSVLGSGSQTAGFQDGAVQQPVSTNPAERRARAIALLNKMRGGGG
jgi:hypothetical protein